MESLEGKKLDGRYSLEKLVGVGGMAMVYKATDLKYGRPVAVKILKEEFSSNEELVKRFKNESKAIAVLDHPNIVKIYDISFNEHIQYLVMEYVDGITLKSYLDHANGCLSWKETIFFVEQVLSALQHAHSKGIVHRDIKPQNIMLLPDRSVRVMDFGIARMSRAVNYAENNEKVIGSVHYISPEQARGALTDARSDIYSVGVMMYEMLSGQLPFDGDSAVNIAIKQISEKPKPLSESDKEIPEALCQITEKAMSKRPENRYQSADEMLEALEMFKSNPSIRFAYRYLTASDEVAEKKMKKASYSAETYTQSRAGKSQSTASASAIKTKRKKKKKKRHIFVPLLLALTIAVAVGSGILCYLIFTNSSNPLFSTKENVDLVNFVGMRRSEVEGNSEYDCFDIQFDEEYNTDVEAGVIYSQTPKPPREVKEGQKVTLKVSLGTLWVTIPDVTNYSQADAEQAMKSKGLSVNVRQTVDDSVAEGTVVRTDPAAGEQISSGDTVVIYVAHEKVVAKRAVPNIVGLTMGDVQTALRNAGLSVGVISEGYSAEYGEGVIISQYPEAQTEVLPNTKINVTISLGPEPLPEPTEDEDDEDEDDD